MICQYCSSDKLRKRGRYKTKTATVQKYQCKPCGKLQSKRTNAHTYRLRKQRLAKKVVALYCKRMSLRGIARTLGVSRETVNKYFVREAHKARTENLKALANKDMVTTYVHFDSLETFEHTKKRPLGVWLSVRAKTGELIAAKVHRTDIRALATDRGTIRKWNAATDKEQSLIEFLMETEKAFNRVHTTVGCDGLKSQIKTAKQLFGDSAEVVELGENKKIDLAIRKLRNDISRLSRKSLCSTKKAEQLQNHLDLYIWYHNRKRLPRSSS